jgi:hypothetical protein
MVSLLGFVMKIRQQCNPTYHYREQYNAAHLVYASLEIRRAIAFA